ncbi:MAG: hypothetical protein M1819_003387 [Sarea resinae]|nr:MAG: hypothetical protein M1819_003387 [Sarea resinae]
MLAKLLPLLSLLTLGLSAPTPSPDSIIPWSSVPFTVSVQVYPGHSCNDTSLSQYELHLTECQTLTYGPGESFRVVTDIPDDWQLYAYSSDDCTGGTYDVAIPPYANASTCYITGVTQGTAGQSNSAVFKYIG